MASLFLRFVNETLPSTRRTTDTQAQTAFAEASFHDERIYLADLSVPEGSRLPLIPNPQRLRPNRSGRALELSGPLLTEG